MNRLDKSVLLGSVLLTFMGGLTSSKAVFADVAKCLEWKSVCIKSSGANMTGNCVEKISLCSKYESDALKCVKYEKMYVDFIESYQSRYKCNFVSTCYSEIGKYDICEDKHSISVSCPVWNSIWHCWSWCYETKYRTAYRKENVCVQWDINIKFGNAEIDPNLIEY